MEGVILRETPLKISNMKYWQTVPPVILGYGQNGFKLKELKELEHLRGKLVISGLETIVDAAEASEVNLKDRKCLSKIQLRWNANAGRADSSRKEKEVLDALRSHTNLTELQIVFYRGTILSDWVGDYPFANLVSVCLRNCENCWVLPPLGQLPALKDLVIDGFVSVASVGDEIHGNGTCRC
ncbi:LRR domain containing protein [Parasponia andersonii]|uniref:LRR domain containing protein n=1 Tax=Parasponia andersonii TaxID=3476 RepID=A0A2P5DMA1_PARAD|nr:LRR domain containing protein [Parasponia andersonii]